MRLCDVDGCDRQHKARGWCHLHYRRWLRNGDPLTLVGWAPHGTVRIPAAPLVSAVERRGGLPECIPDYRTREGMRLRRAYVRAKQRGWLYDRAADDLAVHLLGLTLDEVWTEVPA